LTRIAALALATWTVTGCTDPYGLCPDVPTLWQPDDLAELRLRCELVPELCGLPVASTIRERDPDVAIDIVFVGDGYTPSLLAAYRARVAGLISDLTADAEGIVGRDPALFNFHRIDLVAPSTEVADRALRSCKREDGGSRFLVGDDFRVERAVAMAPAADVVVVLVADTDYARGTAGVSLFGTPIIRMLHGDSHRVLTHELGHALIGLADEYVDFDRAHPVVGRYVRWTTSPLPPNLSLDPDETWGGLVNGTREGGGRFATGVYRPTDRCRMFDAHRAVPFCPVCSAAVDAVLAARRGIDDGAPRCGLAIGPNDLVAFGRDASGLGSLVLTHHVDELEIESTTEPHALRPLAAAAPVWFEVHWSALAGEVRLTCVDTLGEITEVALDAGD
jgi:hypothetical protein